MTCSDNVELRFKSYNWHVQQVDGHNRKEIMAALEAAVAETSKPSIIIAKTCIAHGAPTKAGTRESHGEPLGQEEVAQMKKNLGWPVDNPFFVPEDVRQLWAEVQSAKETTRKQWEEMFKRWREEYPELAKMWDAMQERQVPENITDILLASVDISKTAATRESGGIALQEAIKLIPSLVGGSADLSPSTKTYIKAEKPITKDDFEGRNFHFGIREHAMGSIMNGLALYGGFIPFGSTFLVFSDYTRPTHRLAAINGSQVIYVYTHDSIFVGEDGPTHEPIEHFASLRAIPGFTVIRPADAAETAVAWAAALKNSDGPTALMLSRQKIPSITSNPETAKGLEKGAYVVVDVPYEEMHGILIATGSEVHIAIEAQKLLAQEGINFRVVSMPSFELFEQQDEEYQESVLPEEVEIRIAIEAGTTFGWERYVGRWGLVIGMGRFGASAPAPVLAEQFGFTA
ncbi:MAG TPA: transketolase C-terminal domain-containing protein, partial [Armatimonadota bacterium]|nr:transketolase C-terminal domain-containing protein [Armatimonadota bacterium]